MLLYLEFDQIWDFEFEGVLDGVGDVWGSDGVVRGGFVGF